MSEREFKIGDAYRFIFAAPGPDITFLTVTGIARDGTVHTQDLYFGFPVLFPPERQGQLKDIAIMTPEEEKLLNRYWSRNRQPKKDATTYYVTFKATCTACSYDEPQPDCEVCAGDVTYDERVAVPEDVVAKIQKGA